MPFATHWNIEISSIFVRVPNFCKNVPFGVQISCCCLHLRGSVHYTTGVCNSIKKDSAVNMFKQNLNCTYKIQVDVHTHSTSLPMPSYPPRRT